MSNRERIIEFLIAHQPEIKDRVIDLRIEYKRRLDREDSLFRLDLTEQYEARIRQLISFVVSDNTNLPIEKVIIQIEKIEIDEYLEI
jgi:hypothetical protein